MILRALGKLLKTGFSSALPARFGGEEFVVMDTENPAKFLDELAALKNAIEDSDVLIEGKKVPFTVSIGVATGSESITQLIRRADDNLYVAKRKGRNLLVS